MPAVSDEGPIETGDVILKEVTQDVFKLFRQTATGRDFLVDIGKPARYVNPENTATIRRYSSKNWSG
mgnify:CR=1 FL=1